VRGLLQEYNRANYNIDCCKDTCLLLNHFTRETGLDSDEDDYIKPSLFQRIYYGKLRGMLNILAFASSVFFSLFVIFGEFLIFRGSSIEGIFKSTIDKLNYTFYFVITSNTDSVLGTFLLHDRMHLPYTLRAGAQGIFRTIFEADR
jgi:hypothetical protein